MTFKETISHLRKSPADGWYYIQGNLRLIAYRSKHFKWLLRKHITEQFERRRDKLAKACYLNGTCLCCGCDTPSLFFANKACSVEKNSDCQDQNLKQCYQPMLDRQKWEKLKTYIES